MMAAGYGYTRIASILLEHGANAHATLPNGKNALDKVISGVTDIDRFSWGTCQSDTVRFLRQSVPDLEPKGTRQTEKLLVTWRLQAGRFYLLKLLDGINRGAYHAFRENTAYSHRLDGGGLADVDCPGVHAG